jgi:molecular chaperone DnaK (HSP70)
MNLYQLLFAVLFIVDTIEIINVKELRNINTQSIFILVPVPIEAFCITVPTIRKLISIQSPCISIGKGNIRNLEDATTSTTTTTTIRITISSKAHSNKIEIGVGIDLGTTNSAIAYLQSNKDGTVIPTIMNIPKNGRTVPSIVAIQHEQQYLSTGNTTGAVFVGKDALRFMNDDTMTTSEEIQYNDNNNNTMIYRNVKRIIGTGGKIISSTIPHSQSKNNKNDLSFVIPNIYVSKTGNTYNKYNLQNQIHDAIYHPTLLYKYNQNYNTNKKNIINNNSTSGSNSTDTHNKELYIRPEVISSYILQTLKSITEQILGNVTITRAVIGIPAYFHEQQRNATIAAAQLAGITKVKLLHEPEAAALAYGILHQQNNKKQQPYDKTTMMTKKNVNDELVLVFDLGGGTYDVSIVQVSSDGIMEIIATSGNTELGGITFDSTIAQYIVKLIQQEQSKLNIHKSVTSSALSIQHWSTKIHNTIVLSAEAIRIYLSNHRVVHLLLPLHDMDWYPITNDPSSVIVTPPPSSHAVENHVYTSMNTNATQHLYVVFTRNEMEKLCSDVIQLLVRPIREVAIMAGVLLPGDTSPSIVASIMEMVENNDDDGDDLEFKQERKQYDLDQNDDDMQSNQMNMNSIKKSQQQGRKRARDVAKEERKYRQEKKNINQSKPKSLTTSSSSVLTTNNNNNKSFNQNQKIYDGISGRPLSRIILVGGATRMPCIQRLLTILTGLVPQKTVNPDEAVALGCAIQVGIYDGDYNHQFGTVLTPMQAAILRATMSSSMSASTAFDDDDDEIEFDSGEIY